MADSLRNRVSQIVIGNIHALLDRAEDANPEAMMEQAIRQVDAVIEEVRQELGIATANRHLAQRQHADLNNRHVELEASAGQAIGMQRDDLARAAVEKQLAIEAQLPVVESSLQDLGQKESELSGYVTALMGKKREMEEQLSSFRASRVRSAVAPSAVPGASEAVAKVDNAAAAFGRVFERQTGVSLGSHQLSVDQANKLKELDDLVLNKRVEERLAKLKAGQS